MRPSRFVPALAVGALALGLPLTAQETKKAAPTRSEAPAADRGGMAALAELNTRYDKEFLELDRRRIADLTKLAASARGAEAEAAYQYLFNLAVARDLYEAAEKAAQDYLEGDKRDPRIRALASFVDIIAAANRQQYDQSLQRLERFLKTLIPTASAAPAAAPGTAAATTKAANNAGATAPPATPARTTPPTTAATKPQAKTKDAPPQLDAATIFAVGEAFLQRLIRDGQYDIARKAAALFVDNVPDAQVKSHFTARLRRVDMLGKPAPTFTASDVDGQPVNLADYKGKVVLVDFWATWAPPTVASIPLNNALLAKYQDQGFAVVGVNLDGSREGLKREGLAQLQTGLRRYLVQMSVRYPNVLNGTGGNDLAKAFGVTDIPANFLIGRDGKIVRVEVFGTALDQAITDALATEKTPAPARPERTPAKATTKDRR